MNIDIHNSSKYMWPERVSNIVTLSDEHHIYKKYLVILEQKMAEMELLYGIESPHFSCITEPRSVSSIIDRMEEINKISTKRHTALSELVRELRG